MKPFTIAALLAVSVLSGCVSVLPEPTVPNAVYSVTARVQAAGPGLLSDVVVREPEGARLLSGRRIVAENADGAQSVLAKEQWADSATVMLQYALIDALNGRSLTSGGIAVAPNSGARGEYEIAWRIQNLAIGEAQARTAVTVTVLDGLTRQPLAQRSFSRAVPFTDRAGEVPALIESAETVVAAVADFIQAFSVERAEAAGAAAVSPAD